MESNNNNHQSDNLVCFKIIIFIFLGFNLVLITLGASIISGSNGLLILISPYFFLLFSELIILIGISTYSYYCYIVGVVICFSANIFASFLIFILILLASEYGFKDDDEDFIFKFVVILISIKIWVEFFVYLCYSGKVKTQCNLYIEGRFASPVENLNYQPYDVLIPNNQVQNAENQIQHNINNQNTIYPFPPPGQNINNQNMVYAIPPPVKNNEYQDIH